MAGVVAFYNLSTSPYREPVKLVTNTVTGIKQRVSQVFEAYPVVSCTIYHKIKIVLFLTQKQKAYENIKQIPSIGRLMCLHC